MKKIELVKETLRVLDAEEVVHVAGGNGDKSTFPTTSIGGKPAPVARELPTRAPCATFPVNVCVTGRC